MCFSCSLFAPYRWEERDVKVNRRISATFSGECSWKDNAQMCALNASYLMTDHQFCLHKYRQLSIIQGQINCGSPPTNYNVLQKTWERL
jgi:hypothetical protein